MCANRAKMIFPAPESLGAVLVRDRRAYNLRKRWAMLCGNRSQNKRVRTRGSDFTCCSSGSKSASLGAIIMSSISTLFPPTTLAIYFGALDNRSAARLYVVLVVRTDFESFRLSRSDMRWMHRPARHPGHAELNSRLHIGCCLRARSSGRGASFS